MLLTQKLLPAIRSVAGDMFVFQQDNAPAHRAHDRIELLYRETPQFISPDMWPANSPDLNPVDYCVWDMLQQRVYRVPIHSTDELRKRLVATWAEFQQSVVDYAVDQWRKSLEACIRAEDDQFEHLLRRCLPDIPVSHITTGSFHSHQCLEERNITFSQMKKFSILQGSAVTFFRCGG